MKKADPLISKEPAGLEQPSLQKETPEIRQPGAGDLRQKGEGQIETIELYVSALFRTQKSRVTGALRIQKPG